MKRIGGSVVRLHPEWKVLLEAFRSLSFGEVVSHASLAAMASLTPETIKYYRAVSQARKVALYDHGIEIENEPKTGYRRVQPHRYGERSRRDVRLGTKRIKRGRVVLQATPLEYLSSEDVKKIEHAMLKLNALLREASSTIRSMRDVLPPVTKATPLLDVEQPREPDTTPDQTVPH